ncbi:MAG: class F sortase [Patescibacteria group bacterium]|nr:class F sortase [Patescibacteria group bacterium]
MKHFSNCKILKTAPVPRLFLLVFLVTILSFFQVSTAFAAVKIQKSEAHLIIPRIKVNAVIKDMGLTPEGAMAIPANRVDVGWFSLGTRPGEIGSAVIGGHNRWDQKVAVFDHLNRLKKGDILSVVDAKGISTSFVIRGMRTYDATDINSGIFASESGIHLNLITCSGFWNPITKSYTTRLVIFTDAIQIAIK